MSSENRQDTLNKRKIFTRSDAIVGDDDNKIENKNNDKSLSLTEKNNLSKSLQRDHSYADAMGINVLRFVENTLHKNAKDREFLLYIEDETRKFVEDESKSYHFFPPMSSYNRMLVHRVAAFFGLIHNVDQTGQQVVVTKQKGLTRIPEIKFSSLIKHSNFDDKFQHFGRRNVQSFDETNISTLGNNRSSIAGGPPSFRAFRNRFYTSGSHQINPTTTEFTKGRRTRSFEISDWSNNVSNPLWNQQQFAASFCHLQQPPTNLEIITATTGGGEGGMSSNCSSSASSGAIQLQQGTGGNGLPFQIYPSGQFVLTNEASLISPTSTFSEPTTTINNNNQQQQILTYQPTILQSNETIDNEKEKIPSLFSLQPLISPQTIIQQNNNINPYLTLQPMLVNATNGAQYPYYNENLIHYYPTYYPIYSSQTFIDPTTQPLIEENGREDSTRPIEKRFETLSICQEQATKNNNGNNNNNGIAKSTCY